MQKTELKGPELKQAYEKLRVYSVLDNRVRLEAFFLISDNPGIKFNEIVKGVKVRKSLVAYHLGLLKAAGLVTFQYERNGKATSSYWLTDLGKGTMEELRSRIRKA
jgi:DNA-binding transcriptional ArsR family regulator